jgi:hypothetical protein
MCSRIEPCLQDGFSHLHKRHPISFTVQVVTFEAGSESGSHAHVSTFGEIMGWRSLTISCGDKSRPQLTCTAATSVALFEEYRTSDDPMTCRFP